MAVGNIPDTEIPAVSENATKTVVIKFGIAIGTAIPPTWVPSTSDDIYATAEALADHTKVIFDALARTEEKISNVGGKLVDLTDVSDGSSLIYDAASDKFKVGVSAVGAQGTGFFITPDFVINPGQEVSVSHQTISDGKVMFQVDRSSPTGPAVTTSDVFLTPDDQTLNGSVMDIHDAVNSIRLPFAYGSCSIKANLGMICNSAMFVCSQSITYRVGDYVYLLRISSGINAFVNEIYYCHVDSFSAGVWTKSTDVLPVTFTSAGLNGTKPILYGKYLYVFGNSIIRAHIDTPTKWDVVGTPPVNYGGATFIVGSRVYLVAGHTNLTTPVVTNQIWSADISDLSTWTQEANFPVAITRMGFYQYGDYLYVLGGETTWNSTFTNVIYRAHISNPTAWTSFGTIPASLSRMGTLQVISGRAVIAGGRLGSGTSSTQIYSAPADNPATWTTHGTFYGGSLYAKDYVSQVVIDDTLYTVGGYYNSSSIRQHLEKFLFTPTSAIGSGNVVTREFSIDGLDSVSSVEVTANIPTNSSIRTALSTDGGQTWQYYNGTAWVTAASLAAALTSGALLTSGSLRKYAMPGMINKKLSGSSIMLAFGLSSTAANVSPLLHAVKLIMASGAIYSPMLIASYASTAGEVGIRYQQGSFNNTWVKNKLTEAITVRMKIFDGA